MNIDDFVMNIYETDSELDEIEKRTQLRIQKKQQKHERKRLEKEERRLIRRKEKRDRKAAAKKQTLQLEFQPIMTDTSHSNVLFAIFCVGFVLMFLLFDIQEDIHDSIYLGL